MRRMRRIAEAWNNAVAHTLTRGSANYDPGDDIPDAATRRQFYFLGALAALNCLLNGARPSALQDEVETALDTRRGYPHWEHGGDGPDYRADTRSS